MENFFPCDDCSRHFGTMAAEADALLVQSPDDALLWSWRAHNRVWCSPCRPASCLLWATCSSCTLPFPKFSRIHATAGCVPYHHRRPSQVNERVGKQEAEGSDGDPAFPKVQWPPSEVCPACRKRGDSDSGSAGSDAWDEAAVLAFLRQYYGDVSALPQAGRWHMQWHRKATFARSERFSGRLFHGRRARGLSALFWLLVSGGVLTVVVKSCQAPNRSSPRGRSGNGKFRQY